MTRAQRRTAFTLIELLIVITIVAILMALTTEAVQRSRDAAGKLKCQNNLHQIGVAMHSYHSAYGQFPPGLKTSWTSDFPYLSWMGRLQPFVEKDDWWEDTLDAYQITNYPWFEPPHTILGMSMLVFQCPADGRVPITETFDNPYYPGSECTVAFTSYLGVEGTDQFQQNGILYANSQTRLQDVTDGASNTLLIGERPPSANLWYGWWYAGAGQFGDGSSDVVLGSNEYCIDMEFSGCQNVGPYTFSPGSLTNDCDQFHFWSLHWGGDNFLFADGSLHFLTYNASSVLPALATRNGDEVIDPNSF
jgi:prepilin-type N-terminal cleavage/methylation domain-containing protein